MSFIDRLSEIDFSNINMEGLSGIPDDLFKELKPIDIKEELKSSDIKEELKSGDIKEEYKNYDGEEVVYIIPRSLSNLGSIKRHIFLDQRELNRNLCTICTRLLDQAVMINNGFSSTRFVEANETRQPCGHIFCRSCIVRWLEIGNSTCPSCRKQTKRSDLIPMVRVRQEIACLKVECIYKNKGCFWTGEFGNRGCDYASHIAKCLRRGEKCETCDEVIGWSHLSDHAGRTCPREIISCDLDSRCDARLERKNMSSHKAECKYRIINCPLMNISCIWRGAIADLLEHEKNDYENHIKILRAKVDSLEKEKKVMEEKFIEERKENKRKLEIQKSDNKSEMIDKFLRAEYEIGSSNFSSGNFSSGNFSSGNFSLLHGPEIRIGSYEWAIEIEGRNLGLVFLGNLGAAIGDVIIATIWVSLLNNNYKFILDSWKWSGYFQSGKTLWIKNALDENFKDIAYNEIEDKIKFIIVVERYGSEENIYNIETMKRNKRTRTFVRD